MAAASESRDRAGGGKSPVWHQDDVRVDDYGLLVRAHRVSDSGFGFVKVIAGRAASSRAPDDEILHEIFRGDKLEGAAAGRVEDVR
ncbi:hypothetical protein ONZ51_g4323 [Trametes cubensis]|uniref:Uncharacterized protein n=1 Tax=Trametes cubensis TaxID=1111947 RepID=A0AAD7XCM3_9APHY|nr:hypothetical protein ONZ51_g4323 [Trametes cubensis]